MQYTLSNYHYAARWPKQELHEPGAVTALGVRYASLAEGPEREGVLFSILQAFHSYLLKYTDMILRGHLPVYCSHINRDSADFLRRFLPRGHKVTRAGLQAACRTLHLAFPQQGFDEVYDILTGVLIRVVGSYDPEYTAKIRLVAEAIGRIEDRDAVFTGADLGLPFDPRRFLRWMTGRGILEPIREPQHQRGKIIGFRIAAWPPAKSLLNAKPIGLAYHVQKLFGDYLQSYITARMKEVETQDGMMQLDHRTVRGEAPYMGDFATPCATGTGSADPRTGRHYAADTTLWNSQLDLGKMNMRWVAETKDPLFAGLSRYERQILYLYFSQERTWKDIAKICRKGIKTVQDDYMRVLDKVRSKAGGLPAELSSP